MQTAFQQLAKQLRSLSLALGVVAVQPIGPAYRRTAMFPPAPHPLAMAERASLSKDDVIPRCLEPVEVLVQLEGSGGLSLFPHTPLWGVTCVNRV